MPEQQHRRDAEQHLLKAIELDAANAEHYAELGRLYLQAGLASKAERYFGEALKWDADNETARIGLAQLQTGGQKKGKLSDTFKSLFDRSK